jgi:membrane peptidoglycan carboxypeptidase
LSRTPFLDALVSSEDARFYNHSGFSIHQTAWAAMQGRGGSTLTQQLAKACILRDASRTYVRKINELAVSLSLERQLSKERILEAYANCVYFGSTSDGLQLYGVGAAAKHLLNKNTAELSLADSATLVALLSAPSYYLRTTRADQAAEPLRKQRNRVLRLMLRNCPHRYSKAEIDAAEGLPVILAAPPANSAQSNLEKDSRYFLDYLATTLSVDAPGSRVYTTLCADLQRAATASVQSGISRLELRLPSAVRGKLQAALVAITPDGEVLAMVGGRDYGASSYNRATKALLSPGSSIKSFLYLLALDDGRLDGEPVTPATIMNPARGILDGYRPTSHVGGPAPLRTQFARSDNGAAVLTASMRPLRDYVGFLNQAIGSRLIRASGPMFIGGAAHTEVTPLDLALGYSLFANAGKKAQPRVAVALYKDNERLAIPGPSLRPLVRPEAAFVMAQVMRSVSGDGPTAVPGATAGQLKLAAGLNDQVQVAAKTGTAQEGHAAWFAAVLPRLIVVSVAFTDDNMSTPFAGADVAREIWAPFIREAAKHRSDLLAGSFKQPENVVVRSIDSRRGCLTEHGGVPEYFIADRLPAVCSSAAITAVSRVATRQKGRRR